jgi:hypothetical protein
MKPLLLILTTLILGSASAQTDTTSGGDYFLTFVKKVYLNPTVYLRCQDFKETTNIGFVALPDLSSSQNNASSGFEKGLQKLLRLLMQTDGGIRFYFNPDTPTAPFTFWHSENLWCKFKQPEKDSITYYLNHNFSDGNLDLNNNQRFENTIDETLDYIQRVLASNTASCGSEPQNETTTINTKPLAINLHNTAGSKYDIDYKLHPELASNYASATDLFTQQDWYAPSKMFVAGGGIEPVVMSINLHDPQFKKENLKIEVLKTHSVLQFTYSNDSVRFNLPDNLVPSDPMEIIVKYKSQVDSINYTVGFFMVNVVEEQLPKVVLFGANGHVVSNTDVTNIQNYLNKVYKPAGVTFEVSSDPSVFPNDYPLIIQNESSGLLSNYPSGLRDYVGDIMDLENYNDETFYLVLGLTNSNSNMKGYMPRARNIGFIFIPEGPNSSYEVETVAHELGHGVFHLRHLFDEEELGENSMGSTQNIMDYSEPSIPEALYLHQWNFIQDPAFVSWTGGDDEEGGLFKSEYVLVKSHKIEGILDEEFIANDLINYVTPSGKIIQLDKSTFVSFSQYVKVEGQGYSSDDSQNSIGYITAFWLNQKSWVAHYTNDKFDGFYVDGKTANEKYEYTSLVSASNVVIGVEYDDCKLAFRYGNYTPKLLSQDIITEIKLLDDEYTMFAVKEVSPEKCVNCDYDLDKKPKAVQDLLKELNADEDDYDIDSYAAELSDQELTYFICADDRYKILKNVADGYSVMGGEESDELTLIRILETTPDKQAHEFMELIKNDDTGLLDNLNDHIDNEDYRGRLFAAFSTLYQKYIGIDEYTEMEQALVNKEKNYLESLPSSPIGCTVLDELAYRGIFVFPNSAVKYIGECNLQVDDIFTEVNNNGTFTFMYSGNKQGAGDWMYVEIDPFKLYKVNFLGHDDVEEYGCIPGYSLLYLLENYSNQSIAYGIQVGVIIASVFTLGTTSSLGAALWATVDLVVAGGGIYILAEQEELNKTPEGRDFIESYQTAVKYVIIGQGMSLLYGVGRNIVAYRLAVKELKLNFKKWKVKDLEHLRTINPELAAKLESFGRFGIKKLEDLIADYEIQIQKLKTEFSVSRELAEDILATESWDSWYAMMQTFKNAPWKNLPAGSTVSTKSIQLGTGGNIVSRQTILSGLTREQQVEVLVSNVEGLTVNQANKLLDLLQKYKPNRIAIGGSRVRGNSNANSDLEVGFDGLEQNKVYSFANEYNKSMHGSSQYKGPGAIKDQFIFTGNKPNTLPKILSPEDFFMRSGIRNAGDLNGGNPFGPSGYISIDQSGTIILGKP